MYDSDLTLHQVPLPIYPDYRILSRNKTNIGTHFTIMIPITKLEEDNIDKIGRTTLIFNRGDRSFNITMKDIYCYGEVDFEDEETIYQIQQFKFLNYLGEKGISIYSNYDYKTHSCMFPRKRQLWTETWDPFILARMAHGYLGKPKRILLFNQLAK